MTHYYDQIEGYLRKSLSQAETAAFEAAMEGDPELQAETERQRELIQRLEAARRRQWVGKHAVLKKGPGPWFWWSILTLFSMGAGAGFIYFFDEKEPAPEEEVLPEPTPAGQPVAMDTLPAPEMAPTPLPPPEKPSKALLAFREALAQQEYIQYTAMGEETTEPETERQLNRAIDLLRAGKNAQARELLAPLLDDPDSFYLEDTQWIHALSWLPEDEAKARALLEVIAQNYVHPYRVKAMVLLEKMKQGYE